MGDGSFIFETTVNQVSWFPGSGKQEWAQWPSVCYLTQLLWPTFKNIGGLHVYIYIVGKMRFRLSLHRPKWLSNLPLCTRNCCYTASCILYPRRFTNPMLMFGIYLTVPFIHFDAGCPTSPAKWREWYSEHNRNINMCVCIHILQLMVSWCSGFLGPIPSGKGIGTKPPNYYR